jgi:hypothetical protein
VGAFRIGLALLVLSTHAWAHPGHGADPTGTGVVHYLSEPLHFLPLLLIGALVLVGGGALLFGRQRR